MRTIIIIAAGFVLLLIIVLASRSFSHHNRKVMAKAALAFLPIWFVAAAYNMWIGVSHAGYSVSDEAPIFCVIFGLPAVVAILLWRKYSRNKGEH